MPLPDRKLTVQRRLIRARLPPITLALLSGCVAGVLTGPGPVLYFYDTELPPLTVGGQPDYDARIVPMDRPPIPPIKFNRWLISSIWARKLAARWAELPFAFDETGPEYCVALGVDKDRMLHVSAPVRYRDIGKAKESCPPLIWTGDAFMIGLSTGSHNHQTPQDHGERLSVPDATMGAPLLVGEDSEARVKTLRAAVSFFSGERLMGIDPGTGKEAPVPAQSLLFTRLNGAVHVFLWTPFTTSANGKYNFVRVYKPAPDDGWEQAGICWVNASDFNEGALFGYHPTTRCNPDDFWMK